MSSDVSKRRRLEDYNSAAAVDPRLAFGTFRGNTIYRNRLNPGEEFKDGHVAIQNLLPPACSSALCTTFVAPEKDWLEQIFGDIPELAVVVHDGRPDSEARMIGDAQLVGIPRQQQSLSSSRWYYLLCKPHTGGCLHSKLLLFRCNLGLRVVVCGSNLFQGQWEVDRDCLWVQDFHLNRDNLSSEASCFGKTLPTFLDDLTSCGSVSDNRIIQSRLDALLAGIDMTTAAARLVMSFPRSAGYAGHANDRGGYSQLASVVSSFLCELGVHSDYESSDCESDGDGPHTAASIEKEEEGGKLVYAMAGSFGNIRPDFLLQMHRAFQGENTPAPRSTPWESVLKSVRCMWPSHETALTMNLISLISRTRAIPQSHWNTIPEAAKRQIFFDSPPNPPEYGLSHLGCHAISHAKVLFSPCNQGVSIVYVGSHNFSVAAWGIRGEMPRNVEIGVVLATACASTRREWQCRLPCRLPPVSSTSSADCIPASANQDAVKALEEGRPEEAIEIAKTFLHKKEEKKVTPKSNAPAIVIDLCDSD